LAAVERARGNQASRTAVRPAVLLVDADDVGSVRRVDRDERLDLCVVVDMFRRRGVRIDAERAPKERTRAAGIDGLTEHERPSAGDRGSRDSSEYQPEQDDAPGMQIPHVLLQPPDVTQAMRISGGIAGAAP
jgi:hypothetical protein